MKNGQMRPWFSVKDFQQHVSHKQCMTWAPLKGGWLNFIVTPGVQSDSGSGISSSDPESRIRQTDSGSRSMPLDSEPALGANDSPENHSVTGKNLYPIRPLFSCLLLQRRRSSSLRSAQISIFPADQCLHLQRQAQPLPHLHRVSAPRLSSRTY